MWEEFLRRNHTKPSAVAGTFFICDFTLPMETN
jgi:hypothetical protein